MNFLVYTTMRSSQDRMTCSDLVVYALSLLENKQNHRIQTGNMVRLPVLIFFALLFVSVSVDCRFVICNCRLQRRNDIVRMK